MTAPPRRCAAAAPARLCAAAGPARRVLAVALALRLSAACAAAETLEPPPEAPAGDYTLERADSLDDTVLETTFGAAGRGVLATRQGARVRFRGDGASGSWNTGGDGLPGGRIDTRLGAARLRIGHLAPSWGRGLALGSPAEPWRRIALDRGDRAGFRGRAGEGLEASRGAFTLLAGGFAGAPLAALRLDAGALALGLVTARRASLASASLGAGAFDGEVAADVRGRWRAEGEVRAGDDALGASWRARAGSPGLRSPAEPRRAGPAVACAFSTGATRGSRSASAHLAWWRFVPGVDGARASLEVEQRLVHHEALLFAFEQQRGARREPTATTIRDGAPRQGFACELRTPPGVRSLAMRHEWWGAHAFARSGRGRALLARARAPLPRGASLGVTQAAWAVGPGEARWLADEQGDRLTLRAISGVGRRSRIEIDVPVAAGRVRWSAAWNDGSGRRSAPAWVVEWSRRTRL